MNDFSGVMRGIVQPAAQKLGPKRLSVAEQQELIQQAKQKQAMQALQMMMMMMMQAQQAQQGQMGLPQQGPPEQAQMQGGMMPPQQGVM